MPTYISESVRPTEKVFLVGSYLSSYAASDGMSGFPAGYMVCQALFPRLFPTLQNDGWFVTQLWRTPFEQLLQHRPRSGELQGIMSTFFEPCFHNQFHLELVRRCLDGSIVGLVTTNYDRCIESAFDALAGPGYLNSISLPEHAKRPGFPLFKIHGTVEQKETICATLDTEFSLPDWKFECLRDLLTDRVLNIAGFAGNDFDICPAVFSDDIKPRQVIWYEKSTSPSVNAQAAFAAGKAMHRNEGFEDFLEMHQSATNPIRARPGASADDLVDLIFSGLSRPELQAWRLALLSALGLNSYMKGVMAEAEAEGSLSAKDKLLWEADAAEREGRYVDSIASLRKASRLVSKTDAEEARRIAQIAIGRRYTARKPIAFLFSLLRGALFGGRTSNEYKARQSYHVTLLLKALYKSIGPRNQRLARRIRESGINSAVVAFRYFHATGSWHDMYLTQVQAEDLDAPLDLRNIGRSHMLNLSKAGFEHLNSFVGQVSSDRKHAPARFFEIGETSVTVKTLDNLHCYPEIWKLASEIFHEKWSKDPAEALLILELAEKHLKRAQIGSAERKRLLKRIRANHKVVERWRREEWQAIK